MIGHKDPIRWMMRNLPPWRGIDRAFALAMFLYDHRRLPARPPRRYYDMVYWIKVTDLDSPLRARLTDKLIAKEHIRQVLGEDPCPPTLAVFRHPEEVTAAAIPLPCVIKPTHMSGRCLYLTRPPDAGQLARIRGWLGENYYYRHSRERNYLSLVPGVLCEQPVAPPEEVVDYKFFCIHGEPRLMKTIRGQFAGNKSRAYFVPDWELIAHRGDPPDARVTVPPPQLARMREWAERLAAPFPFIRIDMLQTPTRAYVGELTHAPLGGRRGEPVGEEPIFDAMLGGQPIAPDIEGLRARRP